VTVGAANDAALLDAVRRAREGEREALELVVRAIQGDVYRLALRFLWHPQDAEDATQEILVRIVTGLGGFRGDSTFRTWVYRVACNRLLTLKARRMEERAMSFEEFGDDLAAGLSDEALRVEPDVDEAMLLEEVKVGCTLALLLCLDRPHRLAYILGDIIELDHTEAGAVLEIAPAAFRKRLSRARRAVVEFLSSRCGLVNPAASCRCRRRVGTAVALGRVDPHHLLFASSGETARRFPAVLQEIRRLEETQRAAALYRSHVLPGPSEGLSAWLRKTLATGPMSG